jgi:hypothetical protein
MSSCLAPVSGPEPAPWASNALAPGRRQHIQSHSCAGCDGSCRISSEMFIFDTHVPLQPAALDRRHVSMRPSCSASDAAALSLALTLPSPGGRAHWGRSTPLPLWRGKVGMGGSRTAPTPTRTLPHRGGGQWCAGEVQEIAPLVSGARGGIDDLPCRYRVQHPDKVAGRTGGRSILGSKS